tara:strand:- start:4183 stop:6750 length:2568 start_codon:yes stop_codon:yes gene_type:complete
MSTRLTESYYESMGRGKGVPYMDPTLNYEDVEPDLTKAVNNNIDEQIKDSQQFFRDNIELYNKSLAARDKRWSDLASITKDGATLVDAYKSMKENRGELKRLRDLGNDNDWVNKWVTDQNTFAELDAGVYKDIKVELGVAENAINNLGEYHIRNDKDEIVHTLNNKNFGDFKKLVQSSTELRGSYAAKQIGVLVPGFWEMVYTDMRHRETGLLFHQLTDPAQKLEYLEEAGGLLLRVIKENNPRISDGDLINEVLPLIKNEIKNKLGSGNVIDQAAATQDANNRELLSNANIVLSTIKNGKNNIQAFDQLLDKDNGLLKILTDHYKGKGFSNNDAFEKGLEDILKAVDYAHDFLGLEEDDYLYLTTEHEFQHSDGRTVTLATMGDPRVDKFLLAMDKTINDNNATKEFTRQELLLDEIKNRTIENPGAPMTLQELLLFTHPELRQPAYNLYQTSTGALTIGYDETTQSVSLINQAALTHASTQGLGPNEITQQRAGYYIGLEANQTFAEKVNKNIKDLNMSQADAVVKARTDVLEMIKNGDFNAAVPSAEDGIDPSKTLVTNAALLKEHGNETWLNHKDAHSGELDFVQETVLMVRNGGDVPSLYVNLAKYFPQFDARGLAVYRAKLLGFLDEDEANAYIIPFNPKVNSFLNRELTDKPSNHKTYRTLVQYVDDFAGLVERLELPEMNNFGGVDAYFNKKTNSYSNEALSEMTMPQLIEFLRDGDNADRIGIYGIRRDNLLLLLDFMQKEGINLTTNSEGGELRFDKNFQDKLITYAAYHENQKSFQIMGDVSWISRIPLDGKDADTYFKLFGNIKDKDNDGNVWNEIQYLLRYAADYKIDLDTNGYDKKEEDKK